MPKFIYFIEKIGLSSIVVIASVLAVLILLWMLYLLTSAGL